MGQAFRAIKAIIETSDVDSVDREDLGVEVGDDLLLRFVRHPCKACDVAVEVMAAVVGKGLAKRDRPLEHDSPAF